MSNAYQLYRQQRRSGGERKLDLLNFGEVLLIHIIDVFENQEREICFPQRRGCRASVMKFGGAMDHWVGGGGWRDGPRVGGPLYTFVGSAMLGSVAMAHGIFRTSSCFRVKWHTTGRF